MNDRTPVKKVKELVKDLEGKLSKHNILNTKYAEQNFHMLKETKLYETGKDKRKKS